MGFRNNRSDTIDACGSGILINLDGRHFVLTAGHCVQDLEGLVIGLPITDRPARFTPQIVSSDFVYDENGSDFGFLELAAQDATTIESMSHGFLPPERLLVTGTDELVGAPDLYVLRGYPAVMTSPEPDGPTGFEPFHLTTMIAGTYDTPSSDLESIEGIEAIDLVLDLNASVKVDVNGGGVSSLDIPKLSGASGGGCWKTGLSSGKVPPSQEDVRLVGIHVGTSPEDIIVSDGRFRFARQVLVEHHLRLIAEQHPTLTRDIYARWGIY